MLLSIHHASLVFPCIHSVDVQAVRFHRAQIVPNAPLDSFLFTAVLPTFVAKWNRFLLDPQLVYIPDNVELIVILCLLLHWPIQVDVLVPLTLLAAF